MHSYSIDIDFRKKVLYIEVALSAALYWAFESFLTTKDNGLINMLINIPEIETFINILNKFGLISGISVSLLYAVISWLYNNYIWKIKFLNNIHKIPNLNGKWVGSLTSSYNSTTIPMELTIKQDWNNISFKSEFPNTNSSSYSNNCSIEIQNHAGIIISLGFTNNSSDIQQQIRQYDGYNILTLKEDGSISARYFNNRGNGNHGTFELQRQ